MKTNPFAWSRGPFHWPEFTNDEWETIVQTIRSAIHKDVRTPKYKQRVVANKKRALKKRRLKKVDKSDWFFG